MLILLDCTQAWNDAWVEQEDDRYLYGLLALSVGAYVACAGIIVFLFYWFNPSSVEGGCSLNVVLIVLSILLVTLFSALSLSPHVQSGSLFPSAVISVYCMYLAYSALQSEPHDYQCNALGGKLTAASGTTLAAGMLLMLLTTTYAAFRAGSNTRTFRIYSSDDDVERPLMDNPAGARKLPEDDDEGQPLTSAGLDGQTMTREGRAAESANDGRARSVRALDEFSPVTYNYSFFHLIFALASMYIGMLMTGWGTGAEEKDLMDVGWASVFVKIGAQWLTGALYVWTLVAPMLFPDRDFA